MWVKTGQIATYQQSNFQLGATHQSSTGTKEWKAQLEGFLILNLWLNKPVTPSQQFWVSPLEKAGSRNCVGSYRGNTNKKVFQGFLSLETSK